MQISCGGDHTGILFNDGELYLIGRNNNGQCTLDANIDIDANPNNIFNQINLIDDPCQKVS